MLANNMRSINRISTVFEIEVRDLVFGIASSNETISNGLVSLSIHVIRSDQYAITEW